MNESSCCSTFLAAVGVVSVLVHGCSYSCVVVSRCCFNLHFPVDTESEASFPVLFCHLYIIGEVSINVFGSFFNQVICSVVEF